VPQKPQPMQAAIAVHYLSIDAGLPAHHPAHWPVTGDGGGLTAVSGNGGGGGGGGGGGFRWQKPQPMQAANVVHFLSIDAGLPAHHPPHCPVTGDGEGGVAAVVATDLAQASSARARARTRARTRATATARTRATATAAVTEMLRTDTRTRRAL